MAEPGLSAKDFGQLLTDVSDWYDERGYFNMLKVLYRDHIQNTFMDEASNTIKLLSLLCNTAHLSPTDLAILYETIKATDQFALEQKIKDQVSSCPNTKEIVISKFSNYRQKLMKFGIGLNSNDVTRISGLHLMPVKKYKDSWSMIMDLERRMSKEAIDEIIKTFPKNKLHHALDALHQMDSYTRNLIVIAIIILVIGIIFAIIFKKPIPEPSIDDVIREYFTNRQKDSCEDLKTITPETVVAPGFARRRGRSPRRGFQTADLGSVKPPWRGFWGSFSPTKLVNLHRRGGQLSPTGGPWPPRPPRWRHH